ncbi:MAG: hypothetical protein R3F43_23715, partial [bacterium]
MRRLLLVAALVQTGCFASDDFSPCTRVGEPCGRAQICVEPGVCQFIDALDAAPPGADRGRPPTVDQGSEALELTDDLPLRVEADGADVVIRASSLERSSTLVQGARTVEVAGGV